MFDLYLGGKGGFRKAGYGKSGCSNVESTVADMLECAMAAAKLRKPFEGEKSYVNYPGGCIMNTDRDRILWNKYRSTSKIHYSYSPICRNLSPGKFIKII